MLAAWLLAPQEGWADTTAGETPSADLAVRTGTASGTVTTVQNNKTVAYQVGGLMFGLVGYHDLSAKAEALLQLSGVIDTLNHHLLRESIEIGYGYHLLGGSRNYNQAGDHLQVESRFHSALTVGVRGAFSVYSDSSALDPTKNFSGSVLETKLGVSYRYEITSSSALVAELFVPAITWPASVNSLTPALTELGFAWRLWF